MIVSRAVSALVVPLGALFAAHLALPRLADVPASLAGLKLYAPHIGIATGLAVSIGFGRSRTFFALVALALAYAGARTYPATTLYHAITVALPLTLAFFAWRRETSLFSQHAMRCAAGMAAATIAIFASCAMFRAPLDAMLQATLVAGVALGPLAQPAIVATAVSVVIAVAARLYRREATALALAAAMTGFAYAASAIRDADTAAVFVATSAVVLAVAVLQDIFHMAFRDPLTGLMSRRALDEHFAALGRRYAVAMVDVDHFKRVNDTHGHETGDQVLRMVSRMLTRVAGARAYRYGGEEFALLFSGQDADGVLERLEALREDIAGYPFRLRSPGRSKNGRRGRNRKSASARILKVTVSIGVAQPDARNTEPHTVLAMADKALYRAKHRGRNMVCH